MSSNTENWYCCYDKTDQVYGALEIAFELHVEEFATGLKSSRILYIELHAYCSERLED